jgi:SAM-dependent methyltransferase
VALQVVVRDAIIRAAGRAFRLVAPIAPLGLRKKAAVAVNRFPGELKDAVIIALLREWASTMPAEYHRFIWSNHLLYAKYYDFRQIEYSRGAYFSKLHPLRVELLETTAACLRDHGLAPELDVRSVLDVGSSLGYLLRYAETTVFPRAERLLGIDIDAYAIGEGAVYLQGIGSSVELQVADLGALESVVGSESFDVVTCTGVLQYVDEEEASKAVRAMLERSSKLLALSGLASEEADNAALERSQVRGYDRSMIHNFDRMIAESGGRVVARRWAGDEMLDGRRGAYLVIAAPPDRQAS